MLGKSKAPKKGKAETLETLIGPNTKVKGDIEFTGGLLVEGVVEGNVAAGDGDQAALTLTPSGLIRGDVTVAHMEINGTIQGDVYATEYISLKENARITGNVYYALLEMAVGAEVNGSLVHRSATQSATTDATAEDRTSPVRDSTDTV